jgi:hypothetical protein
MPKFQSSVKKPLISLSLHEVENEQPPYLDYGLVTSNIMPWGNKPFQMTFDNANLSTSNPFSVN